MKLPPQPSRLKDLSQIRGLSAFKRILTGPASVRGLVRLNKTNSFQYSSKS